MTTKTIQNSWQEKVEVSTKGGLIEIQIEADERRPYLRLTPEQADELGRSLCAFALIQEAQESSFD